MKKNPPSLPRLAPDHSLIDTHCHLDMDAYAGSLDDVVQAAAACGVRRVITVGIDLASSLQAVALAGRFAGVRAAVGIHPHHAAEAGPEDMKRLAGLAKKEKGKVVAYGEIGLDFAKNYAPREVQVRSFADQLRAARELDLPVVIHDRDAHEETLAILKEHGPYPAGGVMHCFSGDIRLADRVLELGFFISIPGIVTFNRSETLQKVARAIPIDRLLLETDGPFLAPVPFRGKVNRPEYLLYTAGKIAEIRGVTIDEIARHTTRNAEQLFRLDKENQVP